MILSVVVIIDLISGNYNLTGRLAAANIEGRSGGSTVTQGSESASVTAEGSYNILCNIIALPSNYILLENDIERATDDQII